MGRAARWMCAATTAGLALLAASPCAGEDAPASKASGWRGDGTGKYPAANPPVAWGRVSKTVKGLRYQARPPRQGDAGEPMPDGVVREWLILGPVPLPEDKKVTEDTLPNESQLAPSENERTAQWTWKKVTGDTAYLDFATLLGKAMNAAAYACTNVYSETGGAFRLNLTYVGGVRLCLNGKDVKPFAGRVKLDLVKGWNRLLIKATPGENDWFLIAVLHACPPAEYEATNIAWMTPLPGARGAFYGGGMGVGAPTIVGDRLYLLSEAYDLICIRKPDGKILWIRTNSYFDAASDADEQHPAYKEAEPVAARLNEINAAVVAGTASPKLLLEKAGVEKDLLKKMKPISRDKYRRPLISDVGFSGFTASTDGKAVYAWFATGVTACYDLNGRRKWIRVDRRPEVEHGFTSSPLLVDGKLVVFLRDLIAFDAETGKLAWVTPLMSHGGFNPGGYFHGSPIAATIGGVGVIVLGNGTIVRASDGKIVYKHPHFGNQGIASPVVEGDELFQIASSSMQLFMHKLPDTFADPLALETRAVKVETPFPKYYMPWHLASPVIHDGLAYLLNNSGVLTVVDVGAGEIVYQKLLDLDHFQWANEGAARGIGISPALGGKHLYLFGNNGAALVIELGRVYRQVAKNKLEHVVQTGHWSERQERFVANPVFDGKRLYIRGEGTLYAIEQ